MMQDYSRDFGPFEGKVWLNCAHQGPLPRTAVEEAHRAILLKTAPHRLQNELFSNVPGRLKRVLGKLIGAPEEEIILGNSASYGLHLLANGIPWQTGDEVLVARGDFPADILPWLALERKGVRIRRIQVRKQVLQPEELEAQLTSSTKLLCVTWVHSFNGHAIDVVGLGEICRARGVTFVLNCSQALGTRSLDLAKVAVDAITCVGFKWLCGPYGTGFCWIRPGVRESLDYNQAYWLSILIAEDLGKEQIDVGLRSDLGARRYDVFGTANFFNFMPWTAAIEYLLKEGIERIEAHNNELVSRLIDGLAAQDYTLVSPRDGNARSTLVIASCKDAGRNSDNYEALKRAGVYIAFRTGKLRFSPHLYNTKDEIDHVLSILRSA